MVAVIAADSRMMDAARRSRNQNQISPQRHGDAEVTRRSLWRKTKTKATTKPDTEKAGEHGKKALQWGITGGGLFLLHILRTAPAYPVERSQKPH